MTGMSAPTMAATASARPDAAFELDRVGAGLLDQPARVYQRLLRADLVAHERHVGNEQTAADAASHHPGVINHFIEGDGKAIGLALHHHAKRIADEHSIDPGRVEKARHGVIVAGQHGQPLATAFGGKEIGHCHWPRHGHLRNLGKNGQWHYIMRLASGGRESAGSYRRTHVRRSPSIAQKKKPTAPVSLFGDKSNHQPQITDHYFLACTVPVNPPFCSVSSTVWPSRFLPLTTISRMGPGPGTLTVTLESLNSTVIALTHEPQQAWAP